jgi:hypothetical protein
MKLKDEGRKIIDKAPEIMHFEAPQSEEEKGQE